MNTAHSHRPATPVDHAAAARPRLSSQILKLARDVSGS